MKKFLRIRVLAGFVLMVHFILAFNVYAVAQFESTADSVVLMEASSGKIIYEKNSNEALPPASITKIMTLLLGFEAVDSGKVKWDDMVSVSEESWRMGGSKMFLALGSKIKYEEIITGISVVSANDGCIALAEHLYGSEEAFVQAMNQKARELGMLKSQFKNSTGLPAEGHTMSATDIAVLAHYFLQKYPRILEIEAQREYNFNGIKQYNRNPLLGSFEGADGLKTGWTEEAGYCLVGTAKQGDVRLISVVLKTQNEKERLEKSKELLTYGFKNFQLIKVKNAGDEVGSIELKNGVVKTVPVKVNKMVSVFLPTANNVNAKDLKLVVKNNPDFLNVAPITEGTLAGKVEVLLNDEVMTSVDVYTSQNIKEAGLFLKLFRWVLGLLGIS